MTDSLASLESFRGRARELSARFARQRDHYRAPSYNEETARSEFISPLFEALGWDVANHAGNAFAYRDVVHEEGIKVGDATKAPDYTFRIGGQRKFFVEAKKPGVDLKGDPAPAYQLRRYAWSAKLPLSILTDFEELAVYDTRIRPKEGDKPSVARVFYFRHDEYEARAEEIWNVFAKRSVLEGSFDAYAEDNRRKRGTSEVDSEFLKEIEGWREELAKNIALRNPGLSVDELNYAVQATIDRILFLRIAEGRGAEVYGRLLGLTNAGAIYERLTALYREADERYNSGLFDFRPDHGDRLTLGLTIDDKVLKPILAHLYYPQSPYEFSVLPPEILGNVYEQFLGKVIRLTAGGRAKVEEKPEVKKAGGVYYTPTYIVDYIVGHTVGELVKGKSPKEMAKLRVLDPACGSGSFLLVAYQRLLDAHLAWYREHEPKKHKEAVFEGPGGEWRLTTAEKRKILVQSIYGVDIDRQAVEVTKLSLLLKCLEGETNETLRQMNLYGERALPSLEKNIQCGNSLISPEALRAHSGELFSNDAVFRLVNPFDWNRAFPDAFKSGGFDVVIGNPPYGYHEIHSNQIKPVLKNEFQAAHGSFENYFLFYEASLRLLRASGLHGFIVPLTWLTIPSALELRKYILKNYSLKRIDWLPELVFKNAQVNTLISVIEAADGAGNVVEVAIHGKLDPRSEPRVRRHIPQERFIRDEFKIGIFTEEADLDLIRKLESSSVPLEKLGTPRSGYNPYERGKGTAPGGGPQTAQTVQDKPYHAAEQLGNEWKPEIGGRDVRRYHITRSGDRWIKYGPWLAAPRASENFRGTRLLVQEIVGGADRRIAAAFTDEEVYHSRDVIPVLVPAGRSQALYLLGVLNSRLISWYHHRRSPKAKKKLFPKVLVSDLARLPFKDVRTSSGSPEGLALEISENVERMMALHERLAACKTDHDRRLHERQVESLDAEIDRLVYELYELTPEEIAIVEKG